MNIIFRLVLTLLPIGYMFIIWLQSSKFNPSQLEYIYPSIHPLVFLVIGVTLELGHLIQFGILYLFLIMVFLTRGELTARKEIVALSIAILYGLIDETHQYFVPFRSFSAIDIVKNIIGIFVCWYIIHKSYFVNKQSKVGLLLKRITRISKNHKESIHL